MLVGWPGVEYEQFLFRYDYKYRFCNGFWLSIDFHYLLFLRGGLSVDARQCILNYVIGNTIALTCL